MDPKLHISDADMMEQYDLSTKISGHVNDLHDAVNDMVSLEKQLADLPAGKALNDKIQAVQDVMANLRSKASEDPLNYAIGLDDKMGGFAGTVAGSEGKPSDGIMEVYNDLEPQFVAIMAKWKAIQVTDVPAFQCAPDRLGRQDDRGRPPADVVWRPPWGWRRVSTQPTGSAARGDRAHAGRYTAWRAPARRHAALRRCLGRRRLSAAPRPDGERHGVRAGARSSVPFEARLRHAAADHPHPGPAWRGRVGGSPGPAHYRLLTVHFAWALIPGADARRGRVCQPAYTGAVLGVRGPGPDVLSTIHQLHLRLSLRDYPAAGKAVVTWSAVGLLWLLVSGVYHWWPLMRVGVRRATAPRRFWRDLHSSLGILSVVVMFVLTLTGLLIGFDAQAVPWLYRITATSPVVMNARPPAFHIVPRGAPMSPDEAIAMARRALPGASPIQVNVPGPTGAYLVAARFPEDLTPGGRSRVYLNPYTREVLLAEGSRTAPTGTRLVTLNRAIHTGDLFGLPGKAVVSVTCLFLVTQALSGLMLWGRRKWPGKTT